MTERTTYSPVLVDTGPLVAMRNLADSQHALCVDTLKLIRPPLLSCWPVLTEAAWMLRHNPVLVRRMLKTVPQGLLALLDVPATEVGEIESLHAKYDDLSPQLADLALLHLAQREHIDTVFTLDRRDFLVFRLRGNKHLRLLPAGP